MRNYAERIAKEINEKYKDLNAAVVEITKMNDVKLVAVKLKKNDEDYGSMNYVDGYFEDGVSVEECAKAIIETFESCRRPELAENDLTWDDVKECIGMRLINVDYNRAYLADKVYKDLGNGLAIIFEVVKDEHVAVITDEFARILGCDCQMLAYAAQASNIDEPVLFDFAESLSGISHNYLEGGDCTNSGMLVLTTKSERHGASAIYKAGVAEKIKSFIGDYYLLPSSVHEWIIMPASGNHDLSELSKIVEGANKTVVSRCDLLSYGVYEWTENGLSKVA